MAGTLPPIVVELKAISGEFKAKMDEAKAEVAEFDNEGSSHSSHWSRITKLASVAAGAAIVGFGALAVKAGMEYQESTASLAAHSGTTVKAAQAIGNAFLKTAFHTTFSAQQIMQAFAPVSGEFVNMTGHALSAAQAQRVMAAAMDLAEASGEPLASTTKVLADVMLPFHLRTAQAADAANTLWNASRLLGVPVADLGTQFQRLTPYIAGSGMSVQQLSGLMVELSHSLGSGRMATRQAGRAIQTLIDPSSSANKALAAMGVNLFDVNGKFIGMAPALDKLRAGMAKLPGSASALSAEEKLLAAQTQLATDKTLAQTPAVKAQEKALSGQVAVLKLQAGQFTQSSAMQAIFGRQANAMLAVIAGGAGTFDRYSAAVGKSDQVGQAARDMAGTLQGQMKTLGAGLEDLATTVGVRLVPVLARLLGDGTKVLAWAVSSKPVLATIAAILGTVMVAAADHWIRTQAKMVKESVQGFARMVKSVAGWGSKVDETGQLVRQSYAKTAAKAVADFAKTAASAIANAAKTAATWIASSAKMAASAALNTAKMIASFAKQKAAAIAGFVAEKGAALLAFAGIAAGVLIAVYLIIKYHKQIWHFIQRMWHDVVEFVKRIWHDIVSNVGKAIGDVLNFFKTLPGKIMSFLSELPGDFLRLGEKMVSSLLGAFGNIGSKIAGLVKGAVSHIPLVGGILSHVPFLATGGVVTKPTLAMVGEAGPEMVIPMAKLATLGNRANISPLPGGARSSAYPILSARSSGTHITYAPSITMTGTQPQLVEQFQAMLEAHTQELTHAMVAMG